MKIARLMRHYSENGEHAITDPLAESCRANHRAGSFWCPCPSLQADRTICSIVYSPDWIRITTRLRYSQLFHIVAGVLSYSLRLDSNVQKNIQPLSLMFQGIVLL